MSGSSRRIMWWVPFWKCWLTDLWDVSCPVDSWLGACSSGGWPGLRVQTWESSACGYWEGSQLSRKNRTKEAKKKIQENRKRLPGSRALERSYKPRAKVSGAFHHGITSDLDKSSFIVGRCIVGRWAEEQWRGEERVEGKGIEGRSANNSFPKSERGAKLQWVVGLRRVLFVCLDGETD